MHVICRSILTAAAFVAASQSAFAMSVTYPFRIRITQQDNQGVCPAVGTLMPMSITVDRAFPVTPPQNHTEHYHGGPAFNTASPILSASINNAASYQPNEGDIYVTKGDKGSYGYSFLGFDSTGEGFALDFSTTDSVVVPTYRMPSSVIPRNFSTATFTYTGKESACIGKVLAR